MRFRQAFVYPVAVVGVSFLAGVSWAGEASPDLSGTWELNPELSTQDRRPGRGGSGGIRGGSGRGGGPGRGAGGGLGGPGGGGRGGGFGGPSVGGPSAGGRGGGGRGGGHGMGGAFRASETLVIRQEPERIVVTDSKDRQQVLVPDGDLHEEDTPMGFVRSQTEWKKNELVNQREREGGRSITRRYSLNRAGDRLTLKIQIRGGERQGFTIKHVYDRALEAREDESEAGDEGLVESGATE